MKAGDCGDNNRRSEPKHQEDLWRLRGFCLMDDDFFTKGAEHQRARFNSSMMDVNLLPKGDDFKDLPETWVKFFKESKERIAIMCKVMEDMRCESLQRYKAGHKTRRRTGQKGRKENDCTPYV